ncbi:MAG: hypothetical protein AB7E80_03015 [Hyphomicrobiaceae bacterium]
MPGSALSAVAANPKRAAGAGAVLAAAVFLLWAIAAKADAAAVLDAVMRSLHLGGAIVWGGLIVFVNAVQLVALREADEGERAAIVKLIVPRTARLFKGAAHAVLATGLVLALPIGGGIHHRPLLLGAILGGVAMWAIVQFVLGPAIARITGRVPAEAAEKAAARATVARWAPVNLILLLPVTVSMLLAAHGGL